MKLEVPYQPQEDYQCGPAALAMALEYDGEKVTPQELRPQVYVPGREGSLTPELTAAARRHGRIAYVLPADEPSLLREVGQGRPVVVLLNLAFNWWPRWHYAVVIGYDQAAREVILHSGPEREQHLPLVVFDRLWARGGRWGLLVLPPGQLPAAATEGRWLAAALDLERTAGVAVAAPAYQAATRRWPEDITAWIGVGNAAYLGHDLPAAESAYRHAWQLAPASATAANNLAQTLADLGKLDEALPLAQRAVSLGGGAAAQDTLQTIERLMQAHTGKTLESAPEKR